MMQVKVINYKDFLNSTLEDILQKRLNTGWEIQSCTSEYILLTLQINEEPQPQPSTFQERLQIEVQELQTRVNKLSEFLSRTHPEDTKLDPQQVRLMRAQFMHMSQYLAILQERMKLMGIPTV